MEHNRAVSEMAEEVSDRRARRVGEAGRWPQEVGDGPYRAERGGRGRKGTLGKIPTRLVGVRPARLRVRRRTDGDGA